MNDTDFSRGWEQGIHESLVSILNMFTKEDLREEWIYLVEYYNARMKTE